MLLISDYYEILKLSDKMSKNPFLVNNGVLDFRSSITRNSFIDLGLLCPHIVH